MCFKLVNACRESFYRANDCSVFCEGKCDLLELLLERLLIISISLGDCMQGDRWGDEVGS